MPRLSARVRVELDRPRESRFYTMHGTPEEVAGQIGAFAALGVDHLALAFPEHDPDGLARAVARFQDEVRPLA
jgi:alkanesulfonate monooxygenase SsuD/methylene tetrahydromethanopterin reductase-like flavin-dependent oxidoreductase (luciferase family)